MRNSKFAIRNSGYEMRNSGYGEFGQSRGACALLKQKMADATEETLRVCGSSGVVFAFIVGPEGNFRIH